MHLLQGVVQLDPNEGTAEFSEGFGDDLSGMPHFLGIGFVSKMHHLFTPATDMKKFLQDIVNGKLCDLRTSYY